MGHARSVFSDCVCCAFERARRRRRRAHRINTKRDVLRVSTVALDEIGRSVARRAGAQDMQAWTRDAQPH